MREGRLRPEDLGRRPPEERRRVEPVPGGEVPEKGRVALFAVEGEDEVVHRPEEGPERTEILGGGGSPRRR